MATTLTIPLITLAVGTRSFGPATAPVGVTQAQITLDRTAGTASLNSLTATTTLEGHIEYSLDGGTTWVPLGKFITPGGPVFDENNNQITSQVGTWGPIAATHPASGATEWRATVIVTGVAISLAGSLVLS